MQEVYISASPTLTALLPTLDHVGIVIHLVS